MLKGASVTVSMNVVITQPGIVIRTLFELLRTKHPGTVVEMMMLRISLR